MLNYWGQNHYSKEKITSTSSIKSSVSSVLPRIQPFVVSDQKERKCVNEFKSVSNIQLDIRSLPRMKKVPWTYLYPNATPNAVSFLESLLAFDPSARISVEEALSHPYLAPYHDPQDEPSHTSNFDFAFEAVDKIDDMRVMIAHEVAQYKILKAASKKGIQKRKESLSVPVKKEMNHNMNESEEDEKNAMDIDDELRMKEEAM